MESKHWGENESVCDNSEEEVEFEDLDSYVDHKAVTQEKLKLYLPYDEEEFGEIVQVPEECVEMDDRVVHTIKLLQHSRALKELLNNAHDVQKGLGPNANADVKHLPDPPLLPNGPKKVSKCKINYPFRYIEKEQSEFYEGEGISPVTLSLTLTRRVLRKVITTLLAHIGFETTSASVLEVLCDIFHEYMQKMTKLMRMAADREAMAGASGFPDIMEQVFHEMGIGSVCMLHSFYQSRVIMYHARMLHTCQLLDEEYQALRHSLIKEEETSSRTRVDEDEDEDVPEIHFPAAYGEGEGDAGMLQPSLETGFQMLQSLEQESQAQLQEQQQGQQQGGTERGGGGGGSEPDEDEEEVINVSDSPSHSGGLESRSMAVGDFAHSSGQNRPRKRKRKNNM